MRKQKISKQLTQKPVFSAKEAAKMGISRQLLAYHCNAGHFQRLGPGVYRSSDYELDVEFRLERLVENAMVTPDGVICLISALDIYEMTDEIPRENWIAIPHSKRVPKREGARIVRMRNVKLGLTEIKLGAYTMKIFDRERCIVDAFRLLSIEIAIKALKEYLFQSDYPILMDKLEAYARALRVNITPYILALTT